MESINFPSLQNKIPSQVLYLCGYCLAHVIKPSIYWLSDVICGKNNGNLESVISYYNTTHNTGLYVTIANTFIPSAVSDGSFALIKKCYSDADHYDYAIKFIISSTVSKGIYWYFDNSPLDSTDLPSYEVMKFIIRIFASNASCASNYKDSMPHAVLSNVLINLSAELAESSWKIFSYMTINITNITVIYHEDESFVINDYDPSSYFVYN